MAANIPTAVVTPISEESSQNPNQDQTQEQTQDVTQTQNQTQNQTQTAVVTPISEESSQNPNQDQTQEQTQDVTQTQNQTQNQTQSRPDLTEEELLNKTLLDLIQTTKTPELETFTLYLKGRCGDIPEADLAEVSRPALVRVLVNRYPTNAITITLIILRQMGKNRLADQLSQASGVQG